MSTSLSKFSDLSVDFKAVSNQIKLVSDSLEKDKKELGSLVETLQEFESTSETLKVIFELVKKKSIDSIENLVTHALNSIWEHSYEFKILTQERGTSSTNRFVLIKDGNESDIMDSHGGGIVNIIAFILRVIFTLKNNPELRPILVLDEPFAFVSESYHEKIGQLLLELIENLGISVVMVTHQPIITKYATKAYELESTKDGVKVVDITDEVSRGRS